MMEISFSKIRHLALILLITASFFTSCKKDLYNLEKIDPTRKQQMLAYKNAAVVETINLNQFKNKVNISSLGILKDEFINLNNSKGKLMSINTPETYNGFAITTDNIKMIKAKGHTSYVFPVKLSSKKAVSFQNLTIDESAEKTIAFVNTYTPTKKWIADWKAGRAGKFDGTISVTPITLDKNVTINIPAENTAYNQQKGKVSSIQIPGKVSLQQVCTTTTYYYSFPYSCGSGQHGPGDSGCYLTGGDAAGYVYISSEITTCWETGGGDTGGGGGGTTPNPPGDYDPCDGGPTPVSFNAYNKDKVSKTPTSPCDEGPLPPLPDEPLPTSDVGNNFRLDPSLQALYPKFTELIKSLENFVKNDVLVLSALKQWSGLTESQILEKVKFGQGPKIVVQELTGRYGYFSSSENPNVINIDKSWVQGLEQANLLSTQQATGFLLGVTVLHEFVHQARNENGLDRNYEYGYGFEQSAFGLAITDDNAGNYAFRLYKK